MSEVTPVEAFIAAVSPWRRAPFRRRMFEAVEIGQPGALGLDVAPRRAPRHEVIAGLIAAGADVVEETSRFRQHAENRVRWTMKRKLTIGVAGHRAWAASELTEVGLAFAMHLLERRGR